MENFKYTWPWWAFSLLLFSALIFPIQDGDVFMYLAIARESLEWGRIPAADPFLYTLRDWHVLHEWLSYFLWYGAYLIAGYTGVILFKAALWMLAFFWIPVQKGLRASAEPISFLILFLAAKASSHRFVEKSSLFSDLLSVIVLCALMQENPSWKKLRWMFPILFLLGVNLHPGFVVALAWLGIYLLCQVITEKKWPRREALQTALFSGLACWVNPLLGSGLIYPFHTVLKEEWNLYRRMNYEWLPTFQSPFLQTTEVRTLMVLILLVTVQLIFQTLKRKKNILFPWMVYGVLMYFAISANRFMATSSLGLSVLGIFLAEDFFKFKNKGFKNALTIAMGLLFLAGSINIWTQGYQTAAGLRTFKFGIDENMMPVTAAQEFKKQNWPGRIFNEFDWGSYLAWELRSPHSLFIHGHIDEPRFLAEDYYAIGRSQEAFDQTMARYQIRFLFLDVKKLEGPRKPKLLSYLGGWELVYQDPWAVVFRKKDP